MPLPLIIGAAAAVAGIVGAGNAIGGATKMKKADDKMRAADSRHRRNVARFDRESKETNEVMDSLGNLELEILESFKSFSDTIERIQNRPNFEEYNKCGVELPKYNKEELEKVSVGAAIILGGLGGAAVGTAGGFAAAGATTAAVMALGTASTGTAIATLSGAAATNATLAALGGGALAAGGGGMALGSAILGGATLGVGLLVGGIIFNITGSGLSEKADEAEEQMLKAEKTINLSCEFFDKLKNTASKYKESLLVVKKKYDLVFSEVYRVVNLSGKVDWNEFTKEEQLATKNSILLVGLLYNMCKVNLVKKTESDKNTNEVNNTDIEMTMDTAKEVIESMESGIQ